MDCYTTTAQSPQIRLILAPFRTVLSFNGATPFSYQPSHLADAIQLIALADIVRKMPRLKPVRIPFLDSLSTEKQPFRCHLNRVLREERSHRSGVVLNPSS